MKKIPQTDAIFENVWRENQTADENPRSLRLSIDTKAKVKIGNLSRGGKGRGLEANIADDHDTEWQSVLVPFGILNTANDQLSIYFGQSAETSDFIIDCLSDWWEQHQADYGDINEWVIDLDGGNATRSDRTQFIKRMVELAQHTQLRIRLIYYLPYHSKYNPIVGFAFPKGTMLGCFGELLEWCNFRFRRGRTSVGSEHEMERNYTVSAMCRDNVSKGSESVET